MTTSLHQAVLDQAAHPEQTGAPWKYAGNGEIDDMHGIPVAFVAHAHAQQIPLIVAAPILLDAAKEIIKTFPLPLDHLIRAIEALKAAIADVEQQP